MPKAGASEEIVYGIHSVNAKLRRRPQEIKRIYIDSSNPKRFGVILKLAKRSGVAVKEAQARDLDQYADGGVHQGIVALCRIVEGSLDLEGLCKKLESAERPPMLLLLDRVSDPGNLGACLRSAAAFDADAVLITRHHSAPLTPVARKAAAGAAECLDLITIDSARHALGLLRDRLGVTIVSSSVDSENQGVGPGEIEIGRGGVALVLGGEHGGVRSSILRLSDQIVHIPLSDKIDCLNVSAACSILLYCLGDARKQGSMSS